MFSGPEVERLPEHGSSRSCRNEVSVEAKRPAAEGTQRPTVEG